METAVDQALRAVEDRAASHSLAARTRLATALSESFNDALLSQLVDGLGSTRLTINFHPDRLGEERTSVARGLLETGFYLPQSQTGRSSGQRFLVVGGQRTAWEHELFGGVYGNAATGRPVYGALDLTVDPFGGSPRFGSCFAVLRPHCRQRTTLCVGDSHVGPTDLGTANAPLSILAGLFEAAAFDNALNRGLNVDDLIAVVCGTRTTQKPARELDSYVEAQIHGGISLADDVAEIVLDPSFANTPVHDDLSAACHKFGFELSWHCGSELAVAKVPTDYRGPAMPAFAAQVAGASAVLDAAAIGRSAATISFTPPSTTGDPEDGPLQKHKKLWHCLLRFGA